METTVRRALVSVYDKTGVAEFAHALADAGVEILSSGGTARLLAESGVAVTKVSDHTGSPELFDGRVKTLHPKIHGGILAVRSNADHVAQMAEHDVPPIDLVVVNLYPFGETVARPDVTESDVVEMIDIGGPAMVRAAAKSFADVGVVVSPSDYSAVLEEIRADGSLTLETRRRLATRAFEHTAEYDRTVHAWLASGGDTADGHADDDAYPETLQLEFRKIQGLRYGENPHQSAAFYADPRDDRPSVSRARQLQGKELSFNNILDFDAALNVAVSFRTGACAIIKHGNPCGVAIAETPDAAFRHALECDPVSAFGGVIAFNRPVDGAAASAIAEAFYEGVIAPAFDDDARARLKKKKNLRLLELGPVVGLSRGGHDLRRVAGGLLVQDWDDGDDRVHACEVVTKRKPTSAEWRALEFAWTVAKHVKSNAIVYAVEDRTIGVGAGQMSRVDSARIAVQKAQSPLRGAVMASDAFFPFRDGIDAAAEAGLAAVVQPGGSKRDDEVVAAADEHGMAMVFTGKRHFRH